MKKVIKALVIFVLVLITLLALVPFLFKGKIIELIQQEMDNSLSAKVELEDVDLSLISTFPDFKLELNGVKVIGKDDFKGIKLADIGTIETNLDLMSVINSEQIKIKSIGISNASFHIKTYINGADTIANYDIVKPSESTNTTTEVEGDSIQDEPDNGTPFSMQIDNYYLKNINLIYDDKVGDIYVEMLNLDHSGRGDFTLDNFLLQTETKIEALTCKMDGINYLKKASLDIGFDSEIDLINEKYTFKENHFGINDLMLHFDGFISMPDDETIDMDINFDTEKTAFKSVLSLVPVVYMTDFESVKTSGEFALNGMVKGKMIGDLLPFFELNLQVNNGNFQYPDLPKSADEINIDLNITNQGGSEDNTIINLKKFHVELAQNPIDMYMTVKTPISDPAIDGNIKMDLDLASIADVIPSENGEEYKGIIKADVNLKGKVSSIEKEDYESFDANGSMVLENIMYNDTSYDYPIQITKADFKFTPKSIQMDNLICLLGKSDIKANGSIQNYIPYAFSDATLLGNMEIQSDYLDLNELSGDDDADTETNNESNVSDSSTLETTTPSDSTEMAVEVPSTIDFVLISNFKKLVYDNIEMEDMIGKISIKNQKVSMDDLKMKMLEGELLMNGYYETTNIQKPTVDFNMKIQDFDVPKTYETFNTIKKLAPIIESAKGTFSFTMALNCVLYGNMEPVMETMTGEGNVQTKNVQITDCKLFNDILGLLKNDDFKSIVLEDVDISFEFKDGRMWVAPFDVKMGGDYEANISGSSGFDQSIDYLIKSKIDIDGLGAEGSQMAQGLLDNVNQKAGTNASISNELDVRLKITGTVDKPKIKPTFGKGDAKKQVKDELKKKAEEEVEKLKKEAEEKARAEAERLKKEAEEKVKAEADRLKKEAEDKAKAEAEKLKKKAKEEAEKLKKKAADDLKKKGVDKFKKLIGK